MMVETRLRDLREDKDLTQKVVAAAIGIPAHTYGNYELGLRAVPLEILIRLAKYHRTSTDYILKLTDEARAYPERKK